MAAKRSPSLLNYQLMATAPNYEQILEFLDALRIEAGNVQNEIIKENDSIELRKALDTYFTEVISTVRRIRNNQFSGPKEDVSDDV